MNEQIGIDFGTTTSAVCRCTYETDRVQGVQEYVPFNGELYDRTAVLVTGTLTNGFGETVRSDEEKYGWTAWEDTGKYPLLESGFKMDLLSPDPRKREKARMLSKKYFCHLYQKFMENQVRKKVGKTEKTTTVVTYPAKFSGELQAFLKEAAEEAGFANVLPVNEAQAAMQYAMHFDSGETAAFFRNNRKQVLKIMLIDMGAGTTDIAVFEYDTQEPSQVKTIAFYPKQGGYNFGGGEIDRKLYEFYVSKLGADYPADYSNDEDAALGERLLKENIKQHKEQHLSRQLQEKQTASAPMDLMRDARRKPEKPDLRLDREGFGMLLKDYLPQFSALVNGALEEAKLAGEEIDLILLTGGHSQWYFVREMLLNKDPEHPVKLKLTEDRILTFPQPHLVVAKGAAVIDPEAKPSEKNMILAPVWNGGKWGYMDQTGKIVIPCQWESDDDKSPHSPGKPPYFSEGLACVKKDGKWGYMNKHGKLVIPCQWERASSFCEGLAPVKSNGLWGCIDKAGKLVIPCQFDYGPTFSEGLADVKKNGTYGYINKTGKMVIPLGSDLILRRFHRGLAWIGKWDNLGFNRVFGCIDRTGRLVLPYQWNWVDEYSEGFAKVRKDKFFVANEGYIDELGNVVIPCQWVHAEDFHDGLAKVLKNNKYGYIDKTGKLVIPCKWDYASDFHEGLAPVEDKHGRVYIDKTGRTVMPAHIFDGNFYEGFAHNGWSYIDKTGKCVIKAVGGHFQLIE